MAAEVAADRPPDPEPVRHVEGDPVRHTPHRPGDEPTSPLRPGGTARAAGRTLTSYRIAALPILDRLLRPAPPRVDSSATTCRARTAASRIPTATGLLLLLKNLLVSREPLYGVGEWAARHVPELLGLTPAQLPSLNDDRVGRCLDRLFDADIPSLTLAVVVHAVREFGVDLDELHNDSTTITFHGDYEAADRERTLRGRLRLAVTWGHNKDHRPDLKQLLYILTVARDGAVPVQFRVAERQRHRRPLASRHLGSALQADRPARLPLRGRLQAGHRREHGLHPSARRPVPQRPAPHPRRGRRLPRRRSSRGRVHWRAIHDKYDDEGELVDRFSIHEPEATSAEGYRLIWYHSTRKAELDAAARQQRIERAVAATGRAAARSWPRRGRGTASGRRWPRRSRRSWRRRGRAGVDHGDDRGADRGDVPPGAARPARCRHAVCEARADSGST